MLILTAFIATKALARYHLVILILTVIDRLRGVKTSDVAFDFLGAACDVQLAFDYIDDRHVEAIAVLVLLFLFVLLLFVLLPQGRVQLRPGGLPGG